MDSEFLKALQSCVELWVATGRDGEPNVSVPMSKLEGFLDHLAAVTLERDAALWQLRETSRELDQA
jgi:hypothetical protein